MEANLLFLQTLRDLRERVESGTQYDMVRATALLRQLLLDDSPLVHQVNKVFQLKLRFEVCGRRYTESVLKLNPPENKQRVELAVV